MVCTFQKPSTSPMFFWGGVWIGMFGKIYMFILANDFPSKKIATGKTGMAVVSEDTILVRPQSAFRLEEFYNLKVWRRMVHPRNLTLNPKMKVWKMFFLFTRVILRFHVSFPGGSFFQKLSETKKCVTLLFQRCHVLFSPRFVATDTGEM